MCPVTVLRADRRTHERRAVSEIAILEFDAFSIPCEVQDVSAVGARIQLHSTAPNSGQVGEIHQAGGNRKRVRVIWSAKLDGRHAAGLIQYDVYLIKRWNQGDSDAFVELVAPFSRRLRFIANSILNNPADADEAVQEALLKALLHLEQFRLGENFSAWLSQITTNEALKRIRHDRRYCQISLTGQRNNGRDHDSWLDTYLGDLRQDPSEILEQQEFVAAIWEAMQSLDGIYQEVLLLREQEIEIPDIAATLGVSVQVVNTRLHRARRKLRECLSQAYRNNSAA